MKLSGKDLLLVFGIIVAIVVTLTTMAYNEQNAYLPKVEVPVKRTTADKATGEFLRKALDHVSEQVAPRP